MNTHRYNILVIDDEMDNIDILKTDLEDAGYIVHSALSGEQGWQILKEKGSAISAILLDRLMPNMTGIDFMEKLSRNRALSRIPVIMQSAAGTKKQILEGLKSGVYYYLPKPFDQHMMLGVVKTALMHYTKIRLLVDEVNQSKVLSGLFHEGLFTFRTIEESQKLAPFLSNFYPNPNQIILGLSELFINAIEHGNLKIGYMKKDVTLKNESWEGMIRELQNKPENVDKKVTVHFSKTREAIKVTIKDEGIGFDHQPFMDFSPKHMESFSGRGIALANNIAFDELTYHEPGNRVTATVYL